MIRDILKINKVCISFEFFPPKNEEDVRQLMETIKDLNELNPSFVSVTYGAGGSTRERTIACVKRIYSEYGITVMAHLTGICHTRDEIKRILDTLLSVGIKNILALRGDYPKTTDEIKPQGEFRYACDLVHWIRDHYKDELCIGVAGYPEKHPEAPDFITDLMNLKTKVSAGADFIITQLYFSNKDFFRFRDRARKIDIDVSIIPGIMPITNFNQITKFTEMCGASIPDELKDELKPVSDNLHLVRVIGIRHALMQCKELLERNVQGMHFYTLNKSTATRSIVYELKIPE